MTDEAKLKAERDAAAQAMTHANEAEMEAGKAQGHAAASVIAADAAGLAAAEAVELIDEVLAGEGGPPVINIADAAPVRPGERAEFAVTLSFASDDVVTGDWTALGIGFTSGKIRLKPGELTAVVSVGTAADAEPQSFVVKLENVVNAIAGSDTATGTILPTVEPGEPDLTRGLLYKLDVQPFVPIDLPAGTLTGVQTIAMVVRVPVTTGKYRKFCGCASSESAGQGAFGIGLNPQGTLDVWRAGGGQQNPITPYPPFQAGRAVYLIWQQADADQDLTLGDAAYSEPLLTPLAAADGACAIGVGYWAGKKVDPIDPTDEIRYWKGWNRVLTEAEVALVIAEMAPLTELPIDPPVEPPVEPPIEPPVNPPGGGGSNGGELEPINPSSHQVAIAVDPAPRQSWVGMGWGCNSALALGNSPAAVVLPRLKPHIKKVTEDIGATVIRIFTPEAANQFLPYYKPYYDLAREHGVDTVFASSYMFSANPDRTPTQIAEGIAKYKAAGVEIDAESGQNEPDGNPSNAITGGPGAYIGYLRGMREELDRLGCQNTKVLGFEWRHPTGGQWNTNGNGEVEFDTIASLIPSHVHGGCLHIYDKGPGPNLYDNRWMKKGAPLWSTETGNNGSPSAQARFISGLNNGTEAEILHYVMIATPTPNAEQLGQSFLDWNGNPRPWWAGYGAIARNLERGATFRRCRSNDRPPGMPAGQAECMAILAPRQPRAVVAAAKTKGGKWQLVAVNSTWGDDHGHAHAGGHYGGRVQQLTVTLPDKLDATFNGRRAGQQGGTNTAKSVMRAGVTRFTLAPGETIGLTQE